MSAAWQAPQLTSNTVLQQLLRVISLETKFLQGGRSGAKIAQVRVNQAGKYVVAKIDQKDLLIQEMRRFLRFIQKWGRVLDLDFHCPGCYADALFSGGLS